MKSNNNFYNKKDFILNSTIEPKDKVLLWIEYREALNALFKDGLISPKEFYLMTIRIRKRLNLLVVE